LDFTPYFGDPDAGDVLTLSLDPAQLPSGLVFDPVTGIISGTPDAAASQGGPNNDGVYVIDVTATDPSGDSFTTTLTYTVSNPPPVAADDGPLDVVEDTPTTLNLLANDIDPDGDPLTIAEINGVPVMSGDMIILPSGATLEVNSDGTVTYIPLLNSNAPDSFTYTVSDGNGGTDMAVVDINITPVNDVPDTNDVVLPPRQNDDGETIAPVDISGVFEDIDGDVLTFSAVNLPAGLSINPNTGVITGTLDNSASVNGPYMVTIIAADPNGETVTADFVWTVDNIPPIEIAPLPAINLTTAGQVSILAADAFTGGVLLNPDNGLPLVLNVATASAFTDPDGDVLTFTAEGLPEGLGQANTIVSLSILQNGFIIPDEGAALNHDAFTPYEWMEGQPIELQEFFAQHSIATELFDRNPETMHQPYLGGVLASQVHGMGSDCAYIMIEAIASDHTVNVQLSSTLEQFCNIDVSRWDVALSNGASLPSWAVLDGQMLHIQRPLDQEVLSLRVKAVLDNGRTVTVPVDIDLKSGQVTERGRLSSGLTSFADQLEIETDRMTLEQDELVKALASA